MIRAATLSGLSWALLAMGACSSTPTPLAVTEHKAAARCAGVSEGLTQMTEGGLQRLQRRQFLTESAEQPQSSSQAATQLLVAVSHGDQPSPGYGFELRSATLSNGVAELNLHWVTPPAGQPQATVMTSPCLVLALPKGEYRKVVAQDQNGPIGSLDLAP